MALRFIESFGNSGGDWNDPGSATVLEKWDSYTTSVGVPSSDAVWAVDEEDNWYGMDGWVLMCNPNGYNPHWVRFEKAFDNQPTWIQGFLFWQDNVGYQSWAGDIGNMRMACFMDGSTVQLTLGMIIDYWYNPEETPPYDEHERGFIRVWRGEPETGTVLATSDFFWDDDDDMFRSYYIEWKATIHNTTGSVVVRVSPMASDYLPALGTEEVINISGVDTSASGNEYADTVCIWSGNQEPGHPLYSDIYCMYDHLYICDGTGDEDNDFKGKNTRVYCLLSDGEGAASDFTPSAGDNYENADERDPDGDTTYNDSGTPGNRDSYTLEDLSVPGYYTIDAIQVCGYMNKQDAGALTARNTIRFGGAYYPGATVSPADGVFDYSLDIFAFNPATSGDFTAVDIDELEVGVEHVT